MNRMTSMIMLSAGLLACSEEMVERREHLITFTNDTEARSLNVSVEGSLYYVPIFGGRVGTKEIPEINVYFIPPPSRYVFDKNSGRFGYWNHYEHLPTASLVERMASHFSRNVPLIIMALPGSYGSIAPPALQHEYRAIDIMDKALDQIVAETGARRINIAAQSTSASIAAALTTRRNDLGCLALSSGPFDYPSIVAEQSWPSMYSGARAPFSVLSMIDLVRADPRRNIILVADRNDRVVPFRYSVEFAEALKRRGHNARLVSLNTSDPMHHALQYEAIREMIACQATAESLP